MSFDLPNTLQYVPVLLHALWVSIYVTLGSFFTGSILGVFVYLAKASAARPARVLASAYIEVVRNTPLLVQLYIIYFGLSQFGLNFNPLWSALIGMTLNNSAYTAEIFRGGIDAVPRGLREAGSALGMRFDQTFRYIVFKPAIRNVLPALTNQFIVLFLFSSVGSVISLNELTSKMQDLNSETLRTFEIFTYGAIMYYLTSVLIALASRFAERVLFRW
jgi:polar amino acid transport system permease protein